MAVRPILVLVLVCGAGLIGSIVRPADAAAFICPDTMTSDAPRNASLLSDLYSVVSAYCPLAANDGSLTDQQKADRVRRFARQVTGLAYGSSDQGELDVLVDVPLMPTLLGQVDQAAAGAGMSRCPGR